MERQMRPYAYHSHNKNVPVMQPPTTNENNYMPTNPISSLSNHSVSTSASKPEFVDLGFIKITQNLRKNTFSELCYQLGLFFIL